MSSPLRSTSHVSSLSAVARSRLAASVGAVLGDEPQQVRASPGRCRSATSARGAASISAPSTDDRLGHHRARWRPASASTTTRIVVGVHAQRVARGVADVVLREMSNRTGAPLLPTTARRQHGVAAQRCGDRVRAGERCGAARWASRRRRCRRCRAPISVDHRVGPAAPSARRRRPRIRRGRASWWRPGRPAGRRATWRGRRSCRRTGRRYRAPRSAPRSSAGASGDASRSQKSAPLSGGPPSPKVLVTITTSPASARSARSTSFMLRSRASPSCSPSRAANSSALPVCDAHSTSGPDLGSIGRPCAAALGREPAREQPVDPQPYAARHRGSRRQHRHSGQPRRYRRRSLPGRASRPRSSSGAPVQRGAGMPTGDRDAGAPRTP